MSASEKLKALGVWEEKGWDSGPYDVCSRGQADTLHEALPQIVAVVEVTERLADATDDDWFYSGGRAQAARALAALDEALS